MPIYVLDTSALLAWIQGEPGGDYVASLLTQECKLSAVNLTELVAKLLDNNHSAPQNLGQQLRTLGIEICAFNEAQAISAGLLRKQTRAKGLSLGDRACLSLAMELQAVALTGDKAWKELNLPIDIVDIRAG
jgi:ribonuclease VapC